MQDKCDTSFQLQLSFDFESTAAPTVAPVNANNVVHLKFGEKTNQNAKKSKEDMAILEQILLNARKLKW